MSIAAASFTFGEGKGTSDSDLVDDDRVMVGFRDYAGKFAMPVMLLAVGTRFVLKIKQTAEVALKSGEEPSRDLVLFAADTPNSWKPAGLLEELGVERVYSPPDPEFPAVW